MNDMQDTPGDSAAAAQPDEAPKKRRAPRKTAATAAVVTEATPSTTADATPAATDGAEAAPAPKKRRTTRKAAPAEAVEGLAPAAESTPVAEPVAPAAEPAEAAPADKPARAPRSRRKAAAPDEAAVAAPVQAELPIAAAVEPVPVIAAEAVTDVGAAPVEADASSAPEAAADEDGGRRRGRDRGRRRDRRGARDEDSAPGASAAPVEAGPADEPVEEIVVAVGDDDDELADAGALFAEVVSGDYDVEAEPAADEVADLGKRVLRPDPEAPKLHKVLAQAGIGSRREMEQLIQDGQVTVNGEAAHIGMRIAQGDQIRIAGRPIKVRIAPPPARIIAYHKQVGEVVTHHDPEGRPTVFRHLPRLQTGKWLSVGRLDINTEGLLLFTNSGDLANQLMHPRFGVEREYAARVLGELTPELRAKLLDGVEIEGQKAAFKAVDDGGGEGANRWYRVVITEGRNREVRKLFDAVGLTVSRLIRIRYGTVVLPRGLKRGVWVELDDHDVRTIRALAGGDGANRSAGGGDAAARGGKKGQPQGRGDARDARDGRGDGRGEGRGGPGRGKGAQHGGGRGDRQARQDRPEQRQGDRPPVQGQGQGGGGKPRGPQQPRGGDRADRGGDRGDRGARVEGDDPLHIPNPLEQTFDRRFASGSKRISAGFGRPSDEPVGGERGGNRKGGPRQPDPMQTSVGYIGADAYFTRPGGNKGRGGRRR
jgi:23S rRNA pseudouridine2605 synthase